MSATTLERAIIKEAHDAQGKRCAATSKATSYFREHRCEIRFGLERIGKALYCSIHAKMKMDGRLK